MTPEQIKQRVEDIRQTWDDEMAHAREDELYIDVLQAIAKGAKNPSLLAKEALKAAGIDFNRWCA